VFPQKIRDKIKEACGKAGGDPFEVMSKAMAGMALGETWVHKDTQGSVGDKYWNMEFAVLQHRHVTLFRVMLAKRLNNSSS
jgi:hypothetical protein